MQSALLEWLRRLLSAKALTHLNVLNAVFAFAFTPSPLRIVACNKQ